MSKLEGFKWIPLLIKAYSEVQVRKALAAQQNELPNAPSLFVEGQAKEHNVTPKQKHTIKPSQTKQTSPTTKSQPYNYHLILRELKETQRKLHRLESTHKQLLKQLQNHFEHPGNTTKKLYRQENKPYKRSKPNKTQPFIAP
ncbi:hypothetical protein LSG31_20745 [Fodinisporobacter ferrooxydans]|uniref:Transposase n=1 Tax=Fodinisporobacter ferrooxydans TaxID=2901836 RepID=A0ABY4CIC2_9BACL|nr:hypothetical protein LSG31_20745 [Alicyclobacillaceae bacterium MYW30-H2]